MSWASCSGTLTVCPSSKWLFLGWQVPPGQGRFGGWGALGAILPLPDHAMSSLLPLLPQAWAEIWEPERHLWVSPILPWGDTYWASEYLSITAFHGRTFELQGTSASVSSNPCGSSGSLPFFQVETVKEDRSFSKMSAQVSSLRLVHRET